MGMQARLNKLDLINEEICEALFRLEAQAKYDREKVYSLQKRIAALEEKLSVRECETRSINHYLAPDQKLPTSS